MVGAMETQAGELVRAAVLGDEAAFTELVARHQRDLLRVAYVICREPALAEDAAQAAWAIAWRRIGDVKDPTQIRGWLVAVAANEARRTMRSRRSSVREISVGDIELAEQPDLRSDPLVDSIARSDLRRVQHVIGTEEVVRDRLRQEALRSFDDEPERHRADDRAEDARGTPENECRIREERDRRLEAVRLDELTIDHQHDAGDTAHHPAENQALHLVRE